ncbi:hypothetical protein EP10_001592 [Geobacillus icigianus]|uniref:YqzE family protein n=1 Tax=Geobacillus icigianus TaxID=1430331 RepID=A0ABU6BFM5_9BACL|nr:hypothetical protein [Geobacillus icigianus]
MDRAVRSRECRKTVSVLPSFLLPYVQYTLSVIWQAVKAWLETPGRGAKTKQVGFPTKGVILFYIRKKTGKKVGGEID